MVSPSRKRAMPVQPGPSRRAVFLILLFSAIVGIVFVSSFRSGIHASEPYAQYAKDEATLDAEPTPQHVEIDSSTLSGHAIAPKLGNETLKAELGRASWKLFHSVMARFPDTPTVDESTALKSYVHLFQRLYPCGECAEHFGQILTRFPPQVSSRSAAAAWGCHVHNEVNKSLDKILFDCANIGDFYDCGCAEDEKEGMNEAGAATESMKPETSKEEVERVTGANGGKLDSEKVAKLSYVKVTE